MVFWVSWEEIYQVRDAFPGATIVEDTELRRVLALPGQMRVTYDHQGVLFTKDGTARSTLPIGTGPHGVIAKVRELMPTT